MFDILKNLENKGMEKIGLVTPTHDSELIILWTVGSLGMAILHT